MYKKIAIGISNNQEYMPSSFFWNFQSLIKPGNCKVFRGYSTIKSSMLNKIIEQAKAWGADKLFFMDNDMTFQPDTIVKLAESNLPIVSGLYHLKSPPYSPVAGWFKYIKDKNGEDVLCASNQEKELDWHYKYVEFPKGDKDGYVEVDWVGIGCLMVDMKVFDDMGWTKKKLYDLWSEESGQRTYGHDINFCYDAKKAGYKIYVDTTVQASHGTMFYVNKNWIDTYYQTNFDEKFVQNMQQSTNSNRYWDNVYKLEDVSGGNGRMYKEEFDYIVSNIPKNSKVVEMACGTGVLLEMLKTVNQCECYGYDISKVAINIMKDKRHVDGEVADLTEFSLNGDRGKYDYAIAHHILEHLSPEDADKLMKTLSGFTEKNGGHIIVAVPSIDMPIIEHREYYTSETLKKYLTNYFSNVDIVQKGHSYIAICKNQYGGEGI